VSNARACFLVALALACAAAPPALPPGVSTQPELGDSLEAVLAKLPLAEEPGPRVEVEELRVLAVDAQPWTLLEPALAAGAPGRVAVVAGRRCSHRQGLHSTRAERASWFLLASDALVAFDHDGFTAACAARPAFEPAPRDDVAVERMLVRYVTQRWSDDAIPAEQRLARGLALLARDRSDDALAELQALDRQIGELERRQQESETADAASREAWREEAERLRPLRAELKRALRESQGGLR